MASELGHTLFPGFSPRAQAKLLEHGWPGNVRELKNTIERCVYRNPDPKEPGDEIVLDPFESPFRPRRAVESQNGDVNPVAPAMAEIGMPTDLKAAAQRFEIDLLERAMKEARYNQRRAAELLGLAYHQQRGYLNKYNLLRPGDA